MIHIKDGKGRGYVASVTSNNRLDVRASTFSGEHAFSRVGDAYFFNSTDTADTLTCAAGNTYNIMYLKNTSTEGNLVVEKILSSASAAGGVFKWVRNPTLGSVSANTTHTGVNLNMGSGRLPTVTCYVWDETGASGIGGLSGGTTIKTFITGVGFTIHPIDAAIIIPNNSSMSFIYTPPAGGAEFEMGIRAYYDPFIDD